MHTSQSLYATVNKWMERGAFNLGMELSPLVLNKFPAMPRMLPMLLHNRVQGTYFCAKMNARRMDQKIIT